MGYTTEQSIEALPKVLDLATAGNLDLAYATDLFTDSASALQIEIKDSDKLLNVLAKTSQSSNTSVGQLGEAFLTVGGTANVLSGGVDEASTALGIFADNGIKGSEGGTALRNIILSLSAPTDKASKAMKKYGVDVKDADGNMRPLIDIFGDFNNALGDLTEAEKAEALSSIFNKTDLVAVNALMASTSQSTYDLGGALGAMGVDVENNASKIDALNKTFEDGASKADFVKQAMESLNITNEQANTLYDDMAKFVENGASRYEQLYNKVTNSDGALTSMAETMRSTTSGSFKELGSKLEVLAIGFGQLLLPTVDKVVNKIGELVDWFASLSDGTKQTILAIGGIMVVVPPLLILFGTLISSIGTIMGAFTSLSLAITNAGGLMPWFTATILPVISTIGAVIGIVVALYLAIKANWDGIMEATNDLVEACRPYFEALGQAFDELWRVCEEIYQTVIEPIFRMIGEVIEKCIKFAKPLFIAFASVFTNMINNIVSMWDTWGKPLFSAIMFVVESVFNFVSPIFDLILEAFSAMVTGIVEFYNNTLQPIFDLFNEVVQGLLDKAQPVFDSIKNTVTDALDSVNNAISGAIDWIRKLTDKIKDGLGKVKEFFQNLNPFKSKSIDIDATIDANLPKFGSVDVPINPLGDIALSGSYYNANTPLSNSLATLGSASNTVNNMTIEQDNSNIEAIMEKYLGQFVQVMANFNPNLQVNLDGRKLSQELNTINGQGMKLTERWR